MKKLFLKLLILCLAVCTTLCVFVACGGNADEGEDGNDAPAHTCVFDKGLTTEDYKESDATCIEKAKYYYSCECGEKGDLTFEYGDFAEHKYVENKCKWCNKQASVGLEYSLINGNTEYEVVGIGTCVDTDIVIPATYENKPVTSIGEWAFSSCRSLTSIEIPNSVTSIGEWAFGDCDSLTSVEIPNSVTSIGYCAFANCDSLTSIEIPDSVTSIGEYAFAVCYSLTNITVEEENTAYKSIDGNLYSKDGSTLIQYAIGKTDTAFTIPDSVTSIYSAFHDCDSLASVVIPDSVTSIGEAAFYDCDSLASVVIPDSVTSIGEYALYDCRSLTSVVIGNSVTSIGNYAFGWCDSLTSVVIGNSVTSIGDHAFANCRSLTSVVIPDSVTSIGERAFDDCRSLTSVVIGNSVTSIGVRAFEDCDSLTSIVIPDSVTSIGNRAFSGCDSLTIYCEAESQPDGWASEWNVSNCPVVWDCNNNEIATDGYIYIVNDGIRYGIKDGVATVVSQPRNITTANIPAIINYKGNTYSVTSIGEGAFKNCQLLTSIEIPNSVTSIGYSAFYGCSSLTSVVIPASVTSIVECAFFYCQSLTIYCEAESKPSGWDSYWNLSNNQPVEWGYKAEE